MYLWPAEGVFATFRQPLALVSQGGNFGWEVGESMGSRPRIHTFLETKMSRWQSFQIFPGYVLRREGLAMSCNLGRVF